MSENETQHEEGKSKGGFGKVENIKNYYGIHLNLDLELMRKQRDAVEADKKVDVLLVLDGTKVEMTFDEFKSRLLSNAKIN